MLMMATSRMTAMEDIEIGFVFGNAGSNVLIFRFELTNLSADLVCFLQGSQW